MRPILFDVAKTNREELVRVLPFFKGEGEVCSVTCPHTDSLAGLRPYLVDSPSRGSEFPLSSVCKNLKGGKKFSPYSIGPTRRIMKSEYFNIPTREKILTEDGLNL